MTGKEDTQPSNKIGETRATNSGQDQQAEQQRMNAQAQLQAVRQARQSTIRVGNDDVPFFAAPRGHASEAMTRNAVKAREMERTGAKVDIPTSATPDALLNARHVPMPAGGLQALAAQWWPEDVNNQDAMDAHIFDLFHLNRDTLRDDTSYTVGQFVRVPA